MLLATQAKFEKAKADVLALEEEVVTTAAAASKPETSRKRRPLDVLPTLQLLMSRFGQSAGSDDSDGSDGEAALPKLLRKGHNFLYYADRFASLVPFLGQSIKLSETHAAVLTERK